MKVKTLKSIFKTIVIVEDEHKEVNVFEGENYKKFLTFDQALKWAEKEVFNGDWYFRNHF